QQAKEAPPQPEQNLDAVPAVTDKDHILGNKNADVVLVEYSDFECPFCKRFHSTMQQVVKEYGNKVAWVYRQYPLGFHANAQKEAEATECAVEQGGNEAFWKYSDKIMERTTSNGTGFALDKLVPLATELGLDSNKFKQCLDSGKYAQHVKDDMAGGQKAGIQGTPGTVIIGKNGKKEFIGGALPIEQIKPLIDKVLQ
ncbi:DsbA family protein, partial [Patescibacteria group bacterium]|nr:DsbA family protein [Patescibacteria group bacterium]